MKEENYGESIILLKMFIFKFWDERIEIKIY